MYKGNFWSFACISCMAASAFFIAPHIDNYYYGFLSKKGVSREGFLYRILGDARKVLSIQAYIKGDEYYHGGLSRGFVDECEKIKQIHEEGAEEHEHMHRHKHRYKEDAEVTGVSKFNILPYIGEAVHLGEHVHLHGEEEKELLPWFYYAVKLDPKNEEAYVVGGYWVASRIGKADEGIKFLKEGLSNNPSSWRIYEQLGRIYFWEKEDYKQALLNYEKASMLMTGDNSGRIDRRRVYFFTGNCHEELGNIDMAVAFYERALSLSSQDEALRRKIMSLQEGN